MISAPTASRKRLSGVYVVNRLTMAKPDCWSWAMAPSMVAKLLGGAGGAGRLQLLGWARAGVGEVRRQCRGWVAEAVAGRRLPIPVQDSDADSSCDHDEDNQIGSRCGEDGRRP